MNAFATRSVACRLFQWLIELSHKKQLFFSLVLGGVSALAFAPVSGVAVLVPALSGLLWIVHSAASPRRAFALGWAFGFGHFIVGIYWIGYAFFVYAERHALLAVPGVMGMAAILAVYIAIVSALYKWLSPHVSRGGYGGLSSMGISNVVLFAGLWTLLEGVRGWAFTGFPWNLIGSVWVISDEILQTAAFGGVYLLSLLTVFVSALPIIVMDEKQSVGKLAFRLGGGLGVFVVLWSLGAWRLSGDELTYVDNVVLRLVQPNIPQRLKWQKDLRSKHVAKLIDMSVAPAQDGRVPTHVIWPETSVPYSVPGYPDLMQLLKKAVPKGGALLGGSLRREIISQNTSKRRVVWNTLFVMDEQGDVLEGYDKTHLVPFGEYVPFQGILPIEKLTDGAVGFSFGTGLKTLSVPGLPPLSPLICYEVIFSGDVVDKQNRPEWILNITNDAWYGYSAGPFQHYAAARLRAVEEGLPLVRVANTGISGVIDAYGRNVVKLGLEVEGVLDSYLPVTLPITYYAHYKWRIWILICTSMLIYFTILKVVNSRSR